MSQPALNHTPPATVPTMAGRRRRRRTPEAIEQEGSTIVNIALTAVTVLYGGFFLVGGVGQMLGRWSALTPAAACGFSAAACRAIGLLEVLGGTGLLLAPSFPVVGGITAAGLFLLTGAAFMYHSWYEEHVLRLLASAVTAVVLLCVACGLYLTNIT